MLEPAALRTIAAALAFLAPIVSAALPPLGLTQLDTQPDSLAKLAVIDGVAYVSGRGGVQPVNSAGVQPTISPAHPSIGSLNTTSSQ